MCDPLPKELARESLLGVILKQLGDGYFEEIIDEAFKMIAFTYNHRDARVFPAGQYQCHILDNDAIGTSRVSLAPCD